MAVKPQETIEVTNRAEWRAWLEGHHDQREGIRLVTYRKGSSDRYIPYEELVEDALCFGWIDSTRRKIDQDRTTLQMTPRKPNSGWSRLNKERVDRLIASGLMTPVGMAVIERSKADGTWTRFDDAHALTMPDDLREAFESFPNASSNFDAFPPSSRKVMLQWIYDAKRPETRAKRVREIAKKASNGERAR